MDLQTLVTIIHYVASFLLIIVILLQAGKGADAGAALGVGGSGTVFGPRGAATFLSKLTTGIAIVFLITSVTLASFSKKKEKTVIKPELGVTETQSSETSPTVQVPKLQPGPETQATKPIK